MSSSFQNPRNPLAALWASATESYLRRQHPDLSIREIRQLPFMQGVFEHLDQLKQKKRVPKPPDQAAAKETGNALSIARAAYYSQAFFDVAVTGAAYKENSRDEIYELYIAGLELCHSVDNTVDFSTDDLIGFALCVLVYIWMLGGPENLSRLEEALLNSLLNSSKLTQEQRDKVQAFWDQPHYGLTEMQYRDAGDSAYKNYGVINWRIPDNAQIVMIGDWGTSMDDAREFLKALWKQAYRQYPGRKIVFLHLGDIYYCGLPYECYYNFQDVFARVSAELQQDRDIDPNKFDPHPPIFTIPGNHEYYSYGYGYFELLDNLKQGQQCSFFCLRTENNHWQFLGMDTGQADGNGLLSFLQSFSDFVKSTVLDKLPHWNWVTWVSNLVVTTYEDFVGPFEPELRNNELKWIKDRLNEFGGKTIMLSHHQLFSRKAMIDHKSPQYQNTWLDAHFSPYFKDQIAAWYWGHEHAFAVYYDGLLGLNKGRLLGSSSYEVTDKADDPYEKNYPMVAFAPNMNEHLVDQTGSDEKKKLYSHVGAIMSLKDTEIDVKYYQFPAWSQLVEMPANAQLKEIPQVAETIKPAPFMNLKPYWIGNVPVKEKVVVTNHSPAVAVWNETLYMVYVNGNDLDDGLSLCSVKISDIHLENKRLKANWNGPQSIQAGGRKITTGHSPAIIAVNSILYLFYIDKNSTLQGISRAVNGSEWTSLNVGGQATGDAAPVVCFFQGRIYLVYREKGSKNNLCWAYYDLNPGSMGDWKDFGRLQDTKGAVLESPNTPALAADAYHLYMTYRKKDGTVIKWAVGTPSGPAPDRYHNNISWQQMGTIDEKHYTESGMGLAYASGAFIMVYTSSNGNLTQCALSGTGKDSLGTWIGGNTVRPATEYTKDGTIKTDTARSKFVAQIGITVGGGVLVYRGLDKDEIYWAYY
ncbi:metallophosphoesterase family protein [Niabella drilacis]|uniref:Calcineurin-like phosphoesterase n=1 Tax=Niabella drilacis (strain DSM 25811 / CCM 8410 / CCUG 62505 / LMG 26954 / E90) TaxID=1285928 RepID=A0A1G6XK04_NIADE|nr:metallophosphoesterase [Niabella drilacis]SDD78519.1 Calcineurin-like phosphoesterase [Niabella drilacis]